MTCIQFMLRGQRGEHQQPLCTADGDSDWGPGGTSGRSRNAKLAINNANTLNTLRETKIIQYESRNTRGSDPMTKREARRITPPMTTAIPNITLFARFFDPVLAENHRPINMLPVIRIMDRLVSTNAPPMIKGMKPQKWSWYIP